MKNDFSNESNWFKPIDELTFADDFIFGKVMENKEICKHILEILLGIKVGRIKYPTLQKVLKPGYEAHGVRLDVFAEDSKSLYDVEIQIARTKDLPKRITRFA